MKSLDYYLERAGIISNFTLELPINAYDFASRLGNASRYSTIGFFSDFEDVFSSDYRTLVKGLVTDRQFKIKHQARLLDFCKHTAIATGHIQPTNYGIKVSVKMNSFKIILFIYMIIATAYFIIAALSVLIGLIYGDVMSIIFLPFLFLFVTITIILPYLLLCNSTRTMQAFFKKQFQYLSQ
ncbi:hypothetical protein [Nonlabens sp.]|uniref:hypothetical protein n=1 Tax=Nonlabens sp. TaxID=1888209 RepID=UPI003F6A1C19